MGQRSIFNFFSVAAAPATAAVSPSQEPLTDPQLQTTGPERRVPLRCKSAPVQRSDTPDSTPVVQSSNTSSRSSEQANSPPDSIQAISQQQQQQQASSAPPWASVQPSGPQLVTTRVVGRQQQSGPWPPGPGCQLLLQREPGNPVDPCAILVSLTPSPSVAFVFLSFCSSCSAQLIAETCGEPVDSTPFPFPVDPWPLAGACGILWTNHVDQPGLVLCAGVQCRWLWHQAHTRPPASSGVMPPGPLDGQRGRHSAGAARTTLRHSSSSRSSRRAHFCQPVKHTSGL